MSGVLFSSLTAHVPNYYAKKREAEAKAGRTMTNSEFEAAYGDQLTRGASTLPDTGTSIFDPNLAELNYTWFTAPGDEILDPFAGGSVRGIVAHVLGRHYTGIELRAEQVEANIANASDIIPDDIPGWIIGDSSKIDELVDGDYAADFILTCPPYGDLERYSDDEADLSTMAPEVFAETYASIIKAAANRLRDDRFATIIVGNYRDRKGYLISLYSQTVAAAEAAGLRLYNDMILRTNAGSLPIRARKMMEASRKVGRTHQYVLNFIKGSPEAATRRINEAAQITPDLPEAATRSYFFTADQHDVLETLDTHDDPSGLIVNAIRATAEGAAV